MPRLGRKLDGPGEAARAAALLDGSYTPTPPRPAVSVVLARDAADTLEILLLGRASTMEFLPGRLVFPGGGVDKQDAQDDVLSDDPAVAAIAAQFDVPYSDARTKTITAVRETFEETGILLARRSGDFDISAEVLEQERLRTLDRGSTVTAVLDRLGMTVDATDLKPWARWVTPAVSTIRFDVTFFFAALPAGQVARHLSTEATDTVWWTPDRVLAGHAAGTVELATPQRTLITELTDIHTVADAFAARRRLAPVCPAAARIDGAYYLVFPDDPDQ
ncbi:MAG TPA: NUDIX hydrolase [Pseudonocardiaceae bacterium]|nr:NUDIX hydrolase [Pseudonocardiaceae bacterium]